MLTPELQEFAQKLQEKSAPSKPKHYVTIYHKRLGKLSLNSTEGIRAWFAEGWQTESQIKKIKGKRDKRKYGISY